MSDPKPKHGPIYWADVGYTVALEQSYPDSKVMVDFRLWEVSAQSYPDMAPMYGELCGPEADRSDDPEKVQPLVTGFVKWDGCCEWELHDRPHWCGVGYVDGFAQALRRVFAEAKVFMESMGTQCLADAFEAKGAP